MIGLPMAGRIGGHVGKNDIGLSLGFCLDLCLSLRMNFSLAVAAKHRFEAIESGLAEKIEFEEFHARDRLHIENVERDHAAARTDPPRGNLAPATGRRAEIDDARARLEQMKLVVDFSELIGCTGAKALALSARYIGIVDLAFEPGARRRLATFLSLEPLHDASGFAPHAVRAHHFDQHALAETAVGDA